MRKAGGRCAHRGAARRCSRPRARYGRRAGAVGDAGERTTAAPIVHEGVAKNILADALDDEPLGLGCSRQGSSLGAEAFLAIRSQSCFAAGFNDVGKYLDFWTPVRERLVRGYRDHTKSLIVERLPNITVALSLGRLIVLGPVNEAADARDAVAFVIEVGLDCDALGGGVLCVIRQMQSVLVKVIKERPLEA